MWAQSLGQSDLLEESMATLSSILTWSMSWTEEPGGYGPWGCKELDTTERLTLSLSAETEPCAPAAGSSQVALVVENPPANAGGIGDLGLIPGPGRSPGGGHGNPLQYSCLENPRAREAWRATVRRVTKSRTRLSDFHFHSIDTYTG